LTEKAPARFSPRPKALRIRVNAAVGGESVKEMIANKENRAPGFAWRTTRLQLVFLSLWLCFTVEPTLSQDRELFAVELEGGPLWQTRNDVRIPNATGTEFSLIDTIGKGPYGTFRVEVAFDLNERHGFRVIIAPLDIEDSGTLGKSVFFAGKTFDPNIFTNANYKFSSYRFTYRYRFYNGPTWRWKVGFTGFIRDARIALRQDDTFAEDTDLGFVPLAHLRGEARLSDQRRFLLDFEGLGASQGRAFDIAAKLGYALSDRWELAFGYRTIEGGADVEQVYNFAWLHFAVGSIRLRF
jgi:hypothetical protein